MDNVLVITKIEQMPLNSNKKIALIWYSNATEEYIQPLLKIKFIN